jgi:hypothetical protein
MLSSTNFWMSFAGLLYLVAGIFLSRKEIGAARGWEKLITLGSVFIAVSLAVFAPEHFHGPEFVQNMVPSWMPAHWFWVYFVGSALLAAATSLTLRKFERLSSALAHPTDRFGWTYALRDLSFAAGAWAIAGLHSRASSATIEMDDFICAHGHSACGNLLWRRTFSSPRVCARRSFGIDDAIMASLPQCMGIPRRSNFIGRRNRLGTEQKNSARRSLDRRTNDRLHSIFISAYFAPRPRRIGVQ